MKRMAISLGFNFASIDETFYKPVVLGPEAVEEADDLMRRLPDQIRSASYWPCLFARLDRFGWMWLHFPPKDQNGHAVVAEASLDGGARLLSTEGVLEIKTQREEFCVQVNVGINLVLRISFCRNRGALHLDVSVLGEEGGPEQDEEDRSFVALWMQSDWEQQHAEAYVSKPDVLGWPESVIAVAGVHNLGVAIVPPEILEKMLKTPLLQAGR